MDANELIRRAELSDRVQRLEHDVREAYPQSVVTVFVNDVRLLIEDYHALQTRVVQAEALIGMRDESIRNLHYAIDGQARDLDAARAGLRSALAEIARLTGDTDDYHAALQRDDPGGYRY